MGNQRKKYLITIVIIILILAGGFFSYQFLSRNGSNQKFRSVRVERGDISFVVTATGTINPVITVLVGSQVSGTIKALYADFNSHVKEEQVIAQIDPAIFQAQVDQAKANVLTNQANLLNAQANLLNAKANLVKADVAVLDAKRTLDRNLPLVEKKVIAQATLDTAQANYDTSERCGQSPGGICEVPGGIFKGSGGTGKGFVEGYGDQFEIYDHSVSGKWDCYFEECRCRADGGSKPSSTNAFYDRKRSYTDAGGY
jgi:hypothetical protein